MTNSVIELDIALALQFFDEAIPASRKQATAVVAVAGEEMGIALLLHCLRRQHYTAEVMPGPCTQGTQKGVRLDAWVRSERDGDVTYFQTEVKNWSARSIGGTSLKSDATRDEIIEHKFDRWRSVWDATTFRHQESRKVLPQ
jgi:hypothetical protein